MKTSDTIADLAAALAKAQGEMKNATLNKVNPHFKSKYADLAGIRDTIIPSLSKNNLAVVQGTSVEGGQLVVTTRLVHASGQWMESQYPIAIDKPQAMGSAYTYAKRYSLSAMCCIAADEDDDANAAQTAPHAKPEAMPAANGTPGASKAANRVIYDKMVMAIRNAPTVKALKDWYAATVNEIDALPADWLDMLRVEYEDRLSELKKLVAA
jgi:hypothetical protein